MGFVAFGRIHQGGGIEVAVMMFNKLRYWTFIHEIVYFAGCKYKCFARGAFIIFLLPIVLSIQKNIVSLYSAQLITVGSSFLSTLLLARLLGPDLQGEWSLYLQFTQFSTLLLSLGMPGALVYFLASGKIGLPDAQRWIKRLLITAGLVLTVFTGLYALSNNRWILPDTLLVPWPVFLIPLHTLSLLAVQCQQALWQAQNQFKRSAYIQGLGAVLLLFFSALLYIGSSRITGPLLWFLLVGQTAIALWQWHRLRIALPSRLDTEIPRRSVEFTTVWRYSALAFATNLIQFLNYKVDVWILRYYECHNYDLGIYTLSVSLSQLLWLLPQALQSIIFRDIAHRKDIENLYRETRRWTGLLVLYVSIAGVLGAFLAKALVPVLFGEAYAEVSKMIGVLLLGIAPFGVIMIISAYFSGTGRVYINFISAIIGFFVGVLADLAWIPEYGIGGAAAASVASYWSTALFVLLVFFFEKKATRSAIQG